MKGFLFLTPSFIGVLVLVLSWREALITSSLISTTLLFAGFFLSLGSSKNLLLKISPILILLVYGVVHAGPWLLGFVSICLNLPNPILSIFCPLIAFIYFQVSLLLAIPILFLFMYLINAYVDHSLNKNRAPKSV